VKPAKGLGDRLTKLQGHAEKRGPVVSVIDMPTESLARVGADFPPPPSWRPSTPAERAEVTNNAAGLDVETFLIQPGLSAPRLVVTGYQTSSGHRVVVNSREALFLDVEPPRLVRLKGSQTDFFLEFTDALVSAWLDDLESNKDTSKPKKGVLINQNIPFDFAVIAADAYREGEDKGDAVLRRIFEMLDLGMVEDTRLRERLIDLAEGTLGKDFMDLAKSGGPRQKSYALKGFAKNYLAIDLDKVTFRLNYHRLHSKSLAEYGAGPIGYVVGDVSDALEIAAQQLKRAGIGIIPNSAEQTKAAFAFQLMSTWGIRTSLQKVQAFDALLDTEARRFEAIVKDAGLIRSGRDAGSKNETRVRELVSAAYKDAGMKLPMTPGGKVSLAGSVLEDISLIRLKKTDKLKYLPDGVTVDETSLFNEALYAYSQYVSIKKLQTTYLPVLYSGTRHPINAGFETILETGRTSWYQPNLTNLPRGGHRTLLQRLQALVRQCFVPRPGFVFCSVDYDTLELRTLAQVCLWLLGRSKLGEALNAGMDPHLMMAAEQFLKIPYEEALKRKKDKDVAEMRQMAKSASFGFPGGMGPGAFMDFAKATYDVIFTEDEARDLKQKYLMQWPEMSAYFRIIGQMMRSVNSKGDTVGDIEQFVSGRVRGRTRYTAACNSFFQGLAADGAKAACYALAKACYLRGGELYGSRAVAFIHDEVVMEHPEDVASERGPIQARIMCEEMRAFTPDIKITASPALMRCWYKEAETVYNSKNELVCWEPK
jgi:hypothetical protein